MQFSLVAVYLANVLLGLLSLSILPERVVSHFSAAGVPKSWTDSSANFVLMLALHSATFLLFFGLPRIVKEIPRDLLSIPNKDYWMRGARFAEFNRQITLRFHQYGLATLVFFLGVGGLLLEANLGEQIQLRMGLFWLFVGAFLIYTVVWVVQLFGTFGLPHEAPASEL
ncbi:MAG: hypothetical protein HRT56_08365 [Coraliomargarita sp.]|nr:hypothetical protein [Coraliomargarita sp.]